MDAALVSHDEALEFVSGRHGKPTRGERLGPDFADLDFGKGHTRGTTTFVMQDDRLP